MIVELPTGPPVLTPRAARALLRILQHAAQRDDAGPVTEPATVTTAVCEGDDDAKVSRAS